MPDAKALVALVHERYLAPEALIDLAVRGSSLRMTSRCASRRKGLDLGRARERRLQILRSRSWGLPLVTTEPRA